MVGVDEPFEEPKSPGLVVDTVARGEDACFEDIRRFLAQKGVL